MKFLDDFVGRIKNVLVVLVPRVNGLHVACEVDDGLGEERNEPTLHQGVFDEKTFWRFGIFRKLPSHSSIPQRNRQRLHRNNRAVHGNHVPAARQRPQLQPKPLVLTINHTLEIPILINLRNPIQQIIHRNSHIVQQNKSVIDLVAPVLRATVAYQDSR